MPVMLVVAGPPGSGKSSILRPEDETDYFNVDERARDLNKGRGQGISPEIRRVVNRELEAFIYHHIRDGKSFSYETTLRTTITFEQARAAKHQGFETQMQYVALASAEDSILRVRVRAVQGGHSAPPERVREIYEASLRNLAQAIKEFDFVQVYDNSDRIERKAPTRVLESRRGQIVAIVADIPAWTARALEGTAYDVKRLLDVSGPGITD
jgi:predicted ABC-type ATPase